MTSRVVFDAEFVHAMRVRGLTLTEVARRAQVSVATVSSAVRGHQVNVATALRLARAVSAAPVVPELEVWARSPGSAPGQGRDTATSLSPTVALLGRPARPLSAGGVGADEAPVTAPEGGEAGSIE